MAKEGYFVFTVRHPSYSGLFHYILQFTDTISPSILSSSSSDGNGAIVTKINLPVAHALLS